MTTRFNGTHYKCGDEVWLTEELIECGGAEMGVIASNRRASDGTYSVLFNGRHRVRVHESCFYGFDDGISEEDKARKQERHLSLIRRYDANPASLSCYELTLLNKLNGGYL